MDTPYTCCLCDEPKNGYGNNPEPFESEDDERCCDNCNRCKVIPFRMFLNRCENPEEAVKEPKIIKKFKEKEIGDFCVSLERNGKVDRMTLREFKEKFTIRDLKLKS